MSEETRRRVTLLLFVLNIAFAVVWFFTGNYGFMLVNLACGLLCLRNL
jgi:hypothetical protein